jgi:hypothetical protein
MLKSYFLFSLLLLFKCADAHSPQVSTISFLEDQNNKWSVFIKAPLYTFQLALTANNPGLELEKIGPIEMQNEISKLLKSNLILNDDLGLSLANEKIQLGHETTIYYTINNIGGKFDLTSLSFKAFDKLKDHFTLLKIVPNGKKEINYILNTDNKYVYTNHQNKFFDAADNLFYMGLAVAFSILFIIIIFLFFRKKNTMKVKLYLLVFFSSLIISCSKSNETNTSVNSTVPDLYKKIYGATSITSDGTNITIKTKSLPDHKSSYYPISNPLYESYNGTTFGGFNFVKNPNSIIEQSGTFKIPMNPKVDNSHPATPLGPIGIAINGVVFFNQYAGPAQPLTNEIASFDKYYGHPQQSGMYHYHT